MHQPLRTAFDLARQEDLAETVVAVDRPSDVHRFAPDLLLNFAVHYRGTRGTNRLFEVLAHACPDAGSPTETRLRVVIVRAGLE